MANKFPVFTPNVKLGDSSLRHFLYRLGDQTFAIDAEGRQWFSAKVVRDDCGLGCLCAAFIKPDNARGERLLAQSQLIDGASRVIGTGVDLSEATPASKNKQYTPAELRREARALVKGFGRYMGYEIEVCFASGNVLLVAKFIRAYNPNRPVAQQAIEQHTMVL